MTETVPAAAADAVWDGSTQYLLLFLEGILTFISPCLLPLLPLYVLFFSAGEADKRRTIGNAAGFVLGFTVVFIILGAFAGTLGRLLTSHARVVNIVTGLVVIVLGLNFIGVIKIVFFNRAGGKPANVKNLRFFPSVFFGIVFSIGWTPCAGAFLGSALMMAAGQGGVINGVIMLLVYSLGLGIPFIASAVLIDRLKNAFDFVKRNYREVNIISGSLLVITGILMATGQMGRFLSFASLSQVFYG
ncbi:MAG: cytochrome c biogenesis protein CcdA [Treponema sp.]|jgi:cytochrome c-type biogenesis protein|nr:cytochrome c biogenesis protein CcdA [Treponema sp.]